MDAHAPAADRSAETTTVVSAAVPSASGRARFLAGARAGLPIVIGYFPIAVSFGVSASKQGLSFMEATFLSLVIYAGASQFVALALITSGASLLLGVVSLLAMNTRHAFYGPALHEQVGSNGRLRYAALWSFGLTDEVFATAVAQAPKLSWSEHWMAGLGLVSYLSWVGGTLVGSLLGGGAFTAYPLLDQALAFMLPALFISLLASLLTRRQTLTAVAAAVVCLVVAALTGATTGILVGMVAGAVVATITAKPTGSGSPVADTQRRPA